MSNKIVKKLIFSQRQRKLRKKSFYALTFGQVRSHRRLRVST